MLANNPADPPASVGEALASLQRAAGLPRRFGARRSRRRRSIRSLEQRGNAATVIATATAAATPATFLGTESDIAMTPVAKKSKTGLVVIAAASALLLGGVLTAAALHKTTEPPAQAVVASSPSAPAPVAVTPTATPSIATDVEIRVDGVPADTTVTADGAPLGTGGGPFKLPKDKPVKLGFAGEGLQAEGPHDHADREHAPLRQPRQGSGGSGGLDRASTPDDSQRPR